MVVLFLCFFLSLKANELKTHVSIRLILKKRDLRLLVPHLACKELRSEVTILTVNQS